jgi:hypothetical protein
MAHSIDALARVVTIILRRFKLVLLYAGMSNALCVAFCTAVGRFNS